MRARAFVTGALALITACSRPPAPSTTGPSPAQRYLREPAFRRAELRASLADPRTRYAQKREALYEAGGPRDWSLLREWNPPAQPVRAGELDAPRGVDPFAPPGESAGGLEISAAARGGDEHALRALGERAFFAYPAQAVPGALRFALESRARAEHYGVWSHPRGGVMGLVRVRYPDRTGGLAFSCASCHAALDARGALVPGVPNARFDLGAVSADSPLTPGPVADVVARWGPGRIDVTTGDGSEPLALPDLRPTRHLTHLHRSAAVAQRSVISLAIRIETLVITSLNESVRPPREISLGLALYLHSLADSLPTARALSPEALRGRAHFDAQCASCHAPEHGYTGPPVALDAVGTEPTLARSPDRGTGAYRVPSLLGVASRGPLLHDGSAPDLDALFDPARLREGYARRARAPGAIAGHPFGLELSETERTELLAFLRSL